MSEDKVEYGNWHILNYEVEFPEILDSLAGEIHQTAKDKGWWDKERNDLELIMLIVSELSEAVEYLRNGNKQSDHIPTFLGVEEELADAMIRILDLASARNWRVGEAIIEKIKFNKSRSYRHGNKKF